jgi:hypothetical protein
MACLQSAPLPRRGQKDHDYLTGTIHLPGVSRRGDGWAGVGELRTPYLVIVPGQAMSALIFARLRPNASCPYRSGAPSLVCLDPKDKMGQWLSPMRGDHPEAHPTRKGWASTSTPLRGSCVSGDPQRGSFRG